MQERKEKTMKTFKNKWNGGLYELIKETANEVELKRDSDGVSLTIAKSEFYFSYKPFPKKI